MDIISVIRLYSSRLKICTALDLTACSKMSSEKTFLRKEKKSYSASCLQPSDFHLKNALMQEFAGRSGCFLPASFKYLQTLDTEESRGVHNHLVLDVHLKLIQTSQL